MKSSFLTIGAFIGVCLFSQLSLAAPPIGDIFGAKSHPDGAVAVCGNIYLISKQVSEPVGLQFWVNGIDIRGKSFSVMVDDEIFTDVEIEKSQDPYFTVENFVGGSLLEIFWGGYDKAFLTLKDQPRIEINCESLEL